MVGRGIKYSTELRGYICGLGDGGLQATISAAEALHVKGKAPGCKFVLYVWMMSQKKKESTSFEINGVEKDDTK